MAEYVQRSLNTLRSLQRDLWANNRGDIWIPEPNHAGYYPVISDIPYQHLKTAIRKNTSKDVRKRSWDYIKSLAHTFMPRTAGKWTASGKMNKDQYNRMMENFMVAVPMEKGRHPRFLGNSVPGDIEFGSGGSRTIVPMDRVESNFRGNMFKGGGFSMLHFELNKGNLRGAARTPGSSQVREADFR